MADSHPIENWRPVVGYEGLYEVSDLGRVRSLPRKGGRGRRGGQLLSAHKNNRRRISVYLSVNSVCRTYQLHRLVLRAFVGPCPEGMEACHNNGNATDNRLENLRWDTRESNIQDAIKHGSYGNGGNAGGCGGWGINRQRKFGQADIERFRELHAAGIAGAEIARQFRTSQSYVSQILRGERRQ